MIHLRTFLISILTILSIRYSYAEDHKYHIKSVSIECPTGMDCERYTPYVDSLTDRSFTLVDIREKMKFVLNESSIQSFWYEVRPIGESVALVIGILPKKIVSDVTIEVDDDISVSGLYKLLPVSREGLYDSAKEKEAIEIIKKYFDDIGIPATRVDLIKVDEVDEVKLNFKVITGGAKRVAEVKIESDIKEKSIRRRFELLKNKIWDRPQFKADVDLLIKELQDQGHYFAKVEFEEYVVPDSSKVGILIKIISGQRYSFLFHGSSIFSRQQIMEKVRPVMAGNTSEVNTQEIYKEIIALYESVGVFGTKVSSREMSGKDREGLVVQSIFVTILEGSKIRINTPHFTGSTHMSDGRLLSLYYKEASGLASSGYLDRKFLTGFSETIRREYLKDGYVFINVSAPFITERSDGAATVEYKIRERQQCILKEIHINGVNEELAKRAQETLTNRSGSPLNVVELDNDLSAALRFLREQGHYFAQIESTKPEELLTYQSNYSEATLTININLEKRTVLEDILITGNLRTRSKVILREVDLIPGDVLTPSKLEKVHEKITNLGLFSYVRVAPVVLNRDKNDNDYRANILIQLKEKDFGVLEIAPGFRTDIGLKLSASTTYSNFWGLNLSNSIRTQVNQRLDYSNLDPRRRGEKRKRLEMLAEDMLAYPYPFGIPVRFESTASVARRRFYGFDADIFRSSVQVSKNLGQIWRPLEDIDVLMRYQIEAITQYDATDVKDDRFYRIGSLTPTINFDTRDNPVNPHRGIFLSLSWEHALSWLGSMKRDDLEIKYRKMISRNRFYIPLAESWTLAISMSYGLQENLAKQKRVDDQGKESTVGQIPSIKVFRLEGVDTVRGFSDNEINRLNDGRDISETIIDGKAYFTNFKFEPRYMLQDNMVVGVFFDAGRVYRDSLRPSEMRSSVGVTYKFITPVGSLDFDYGAKTKRAYDSQGTREKFGRFHLSIGFF